MEIDSLSIFQSTKNLNEHSFFQPKKLSRNFKLNQRMSPKNFKKPTGNTGKHSNHKKHAKGQSFWLMALEHVVNSDTFHNNSISIPSNS